MTKQITDQIEFIRDAESAFKFNESNPNIGEWMRDQRRFELTQLLLVLRQELTDIVEAAANQESTNKQAA